MALFAKTLRSIRLVMSQAIAPTTVITQETQQDRNADAQRVVNNRKATYVERDAEEVTVGHISPADVADLSSDYGRNAIISLATWSAIARSFNEFVRNPKSDTLQATLDEFHCWNAMASESAQLDDDATLLIIARLSVVKPRAANEQTDAIISRITGKPTAQVAQERVAKAEKKSKQREEAVLNFNSALWASPQGSDTASMPAQKAIAKLVDTITWVGEWDGDGSRIASELLLLESDIAVLKNIARKSAGASTDFEDGTLTTDGLARRLG